MSAKESRQQLYGSYILSNFITDFIGIWPIPTRTESNHIFLKCKEITIIEIKTKINKPAGGVSYADSAEL